MTNKQNDRTVTSFVVDDVNDSDFRIFVVIFISSGKKYNFNVYKKALRAKETTNA